MCLDKRMADRNIQMLVTGSVLMRMQVVNLRLVNNHDVAGSEAEKSASSLKGMTNMPYLNFDEGDGLEEMWSNV